MTRDGSGAGFVGTIVTLGGGGFMMSPDGQSLIDDHLLELTGKSTPKVCFIGTASGDSLDNRARFEEAFRGRADTRSLPLFGNPEYLDSDRPGAGSDLRRWGLHRQPLGPVASARTARPAESSRGGRHRPRRDQCGDELLVRGQQHGLLRHPGALTRRWQGRGTRAASRRPRRGDGDLLGIWERSTVGTSLEEGVISALSVHACPEHQPRGGALRLRLHHIQLSMPAGREDEARASGRWTAIHT